MNTITIRFLIANSRRYNLGLGTILLLFFLFTENHILSQTSKEDHYYIKTLVESKIHDFDVIGKVNIILKDNNSSEEIDFISDRVRQSFFLELLSKSITELASYNMQVLFDSITNENNLTYLSKTFIKFKEGHKEHDHTAEKAMNGPCTNPDFEACNFNDWDLFSGFIDQTPVITDQFAFQGGVPTTSTLQVSGSPTTMAGSVNQAISIGGTDDIGGFPMVYPGGSCSGVIGDFQETSSNAVGVFSASQIQKTFLVSATNSLMILHYAVVLENGGSSHSNIQQSFFKVRVYDQAHNQMPCGNYDAFASDGQAGWVVIGMFQYLPWQTIAIPLDLYVGQNVTVEFTVGDCTLGGHAGYAYVDATCEPMVLGMSAVDVCQFPYTLAAPSGWAGYTWSTGATTSTLAVNAAGNYAVTLIPLNGVGCSVTIDTIVVGPIPVVVDAGIDQVICNGSSINLNASGSGVLVWNASVSLGDINSPTTIVAPTISETFIVTVTNALGCSAIDSVRIVVVSPTVNAGMDQIACPGSTINLLGTGTGTLAWVPHPNLGVLANPSQAFVQAINSTELYTVTSAIGICIVSDQVQVQILDLPGITINPAGPFCSNSAAVSLTVQVTGTSQAGVWSGSSITSDGVFDPTSAGVGSYLIKYTIPAHPGFCAFVDSLMIIVLPQVFLTITPAGPFCANDPVFDIIESPAGGSWMGAGISNSLTGEFIPSSVSSGIHTLTYSVGGICPNSTTINVLVNPLPVVIVPNSVICLNDPISLSATGASTYVWNNGIVQGVLFYPIISQLYTVVGTDVNGCVGSAVATVTVNQLPLISCASVDTSSCFNEPVILLATGGVSYVWSNGSVNNSSIFPGIGITNLSVIGTDGFGCINTAYVSINVHPNPIVDPMTTSASSCIPFMYYFEDQNPLIDHIDWTITQIWQNDTLATYNGTSSGLDSMFLNQTGCYGLTYTAYSAFGCASSGIGLGSGCLFPSPSASFTASNTALNTIDLESNFTNLSTSDDNVFTSSWNFGDGEYSSETNPYHFFDFADVHGYLSFHVELIVENSYGCLDTSTLLMGVDEAIIYYVPNTFTPDGDGNNGMFKPIITSGIEVNEYDLLIFNRWGAVIFESKNPEVGWDGRFGGEIMQDGTYIWKLNFRAKASGKRTQKVGHVNILR
jgi:gliding motility-associated-like protein